MIKVGDKVRIICKPTRTTIEWGSRMRTPDRLAGLYATVIELHKSLPGGMYVSTLHSKREFVYTDECELVANETLEPGWIRCGCETITSNAKFCCDCGKYNR